MVKVLKWYSLHPKMIVVISKFGEIKACHHCMSICKYDAGKKKKKNNADYSGTPLEVVVSKLFLMMTLIIKNI